MPGANKNFHRFLVSDLRFLHFHSSTRTPGILPACNSHCSYYNLPDRVQFFVSSSYQHLYYRNIFQLPMERSYLTNDKHLSNLYPFQNLHLMFSIVPELLQPHTLYILPEPDNGNSLSMNQMLTLSILFLQNQFPRWQLQAILFVLHKQIEW